MCTQKPITDYNSYINPTKSLSNLKEMDLS